MMADNIAMVRDIEIDRVIGRFADMHLVTAALSHTRGVT
jgi:hypothetical protein